MLSTTTRRVLVRLGARAVVAAMATTLAACRDASVTAPRRAIPMPKPSAEIFDAVHGSGNPHFYLLPPLVPSSTYTGSFDAAQSPTVSICAWTASGCGTVVAQFSMTAGTGSQLIRVDAGNQLYIVNWQTDQCVTGACTLDPNTVYRIIISIGKTALGHADMFVVANQQQAKRVNANDYIPLVDGRTLPIKFRVEQGALALVPTITSTPVTVQVPASGGQIASADGAVSLLIPPAAVATNTPISIGSVAASALDPALQNKTIASPIYRFGPDGTSFAQPLTVTLAYSAPLGGGDARSLGVFGSSNGGPWVPARDRVVDLTAHTVSGTIRHFTDYTTMSGASSIVVTPDSSVIGVGEALQLSAALYATVDTSSVPITDQVPTWSSSDTTVAIVDDAGVVTGVSTGTATITATDGASSSVQVTVVQFGSTSIQGSVFNDIDHDASFGPDEVGIAGWTVRVNGPVTASAVTDGNGAYTISGLTPGAYTVCVFPPAGWVQTSPTSGPSCPSGFGYSLDAPRMIGDVVYTGVDFGWVTQDAPPPRASISGSLFFDLDLNQVFDPENEVGLTGWTVQLTGPVNQTAITDGSGAYSFTGLTDGTYQVCVVPPAGWTQTTPILGGAKSNVVACATGAGYSIKVPKLTSDVAFPDFNFGWVSQ